MVRSVPEWVGRTDDTQPPNRVIIRVCERAKFQCQGCGRTMFERTRWNCDHVKAIINGGENRESNLQILCDLCHKPKTKRDVAEKAATHQTRVSHYGLKKPKGRPLPGTKRSGWKHKISGEWVRR